MPSSWQLVSLIGKARLSEWLLLPPFASFAFSYSHLLLVLLLLSFPAASLENHPQFWVACVLSLYDSLYNNLVAHPVGVETVRLTSHVFLQLLFGYRPLMWAVHQPAQWIPAPLLPLLAILFPQEPAWVAGSDSY